MSLLYPDKVLDSLLEEVTYQGFSGINFTQLWELLRVKLNTNIDDLYQQIVYSWLKNNQNLEIGIIEDEVANDNQETNTKDKEQSLEKDHGNGGKQETLKKTVFTIAASWPETYPDPQRYGLRVNEGFQWIVLTGSPKQNNPIGVSAFQLLVEIARCREIGIDSLSLVKATGQDSRSLTSRIKTIGHLIKKIQILKNGRMLSLFVLLKFFDPAKLQQFSINSKEEDITINLRDLREKIVKTVKAAKSGIRQVNDLRRELELDKSNYHKRVFKSSISYLEDKGYISKVLVVSPVSPTKKFRSVKYLKDLAKDAEGLDDVEEDLELNDELIDDELKDLDDEEPSTSLKSVVNLQVVEPSESNIHIPLYNRFLPFQNQIYQVVQKHGTAGCSSNFLIEEVFGFEYTRLFSKLIESYTSDPNKTVHLFMDNYKLVRHYDFQGRVKFYRYVTKPNWNKISSRPENPNGATLPPYKPQKRVSLKDLDRTHFSPLNSRVDIYLDGDEKKIAWYGSGSKLAPEIKQRLKEQQQTADNKTFAQPKTKRGRPRKDENREKKQGPSLKKRKVTETADDVVMIDADMTSPTSDTGTQTADAEAEVVETGSTQISKQVKAEVKDQNKSITIDGISGASFKAVERRAALLRILNDTDGVRVNDPEFINELRDELGYNIDRKTFKNDIDDLVKQGKLKRETFSADFDNHGKINYEILVSSESQDGALGQLKRSLESKKAERGSLRKLTEVSLDIDFFDTELRESFHSIAAPKPSFEPTTKAPRVKRERAKTDKKPKFEESKKNKGYTARIEAKEPLDEAVTNDDLFSNFHTKLKSSRKSKKQTKAPEDENVNNNAIKKRKSQGSRKKRNVSHLNSEETILLFKAVVICKAINENQINWEKITELLGIDTEILRMKWPRIRMMMGKSGVKLARRTWKRILLTAIKEEKIAMEDVEELNLKELVKIWTDSETLTGLEETGEKLYANIEENYKQYKFVKVGETQTMSQYDNNSMIQREQYQINKVFTYDGTPTVVENEEVSKNEIIKNIIIAIVASGSNLEIKKLSVLDQFTEEEINEVFLQMTKDRDIVISGIDNKIYLGDKITTLLDDHTFDFQLSKVTKFQKILQEFISSNKAILLDPVFDNAIMVPILELLKDQAINLTRVDHYRKELLAGYEARTLEREKLDSDIILTAANNDYIHPSPEKQIRVPQGKPCSHLWIDVKGEINKPIWHKVLRVIVTILLSQPGITEPSIKTITKSLLSNEDLSLVLKWLKESRAIRLGEFDGYWLESQWYMNLGI